MKCLRESLQSCSILLDNQHLLSTTTSSTFSILYFPHANDAPRIVTNVLVVVASPGIDSVHLRAWTWLKFKSFRKIAAAFPGSLRPTPEPNPRIIQNANFHGSAPASFEAKMGSPFRAFLPRSSANLRAAAAYKIVKSCATSSSTFESFFLPELFLPGGTNSDRQDSPLSRAKKFDLFAHFPCGGQLALVVRNLRALSAQRNKTF